MFILPEFGTNVTDEQPSQPCGGWPKSSKVPEKNSGKELYLVE